MRSTCHGRPLAVTTGKGIYSSMNWEWKLFCVNVGLTLKNSYQPKVFYPSQNFRIEFIKMWLTVRDWFGEVAADRFPGLPASFPPDPVVWICPGGFSWLPGKYRSFTGKEKPWILGPMTWPRRWTRIQPETDARTNARICYASPVTTPAWFPFALSISGSSLTGMDQRGMLVPDGSSSYNCLLLGPKAASGSKWAHQNEMARSLTHTQSLGLNK